MNIQKKSGNLRTALVKSKGNEKGQGYSYDWDFDYDTINFDNDYIYINNEQISLADLLVNKIIPTELLDDDVKYILEKRNLSYDGYVIVAN